MRDLQRATRTTVKCGSVRVVNEDLSGMSLAEVASSCTEERASNVGGKLRFAAQRPRAGRGCQKTFSPFPLSPCPTEAEISLSLEAERGQLGQAEEPEAPLDEYIQEAGFEA